MGPEKIVADFRALLDTFKGEAEVERNRSLKASLGFSLMRLSKGAREAVKWLGLFRGGGFEQLLLAGSQMDPEVWGGGGGGVEGAGRGGGGREGAGKGRRR